MNFISKSLTAAAAALILATSLSPAADAGSRKRYCQDQAERYADNKVAKSTVGGAIGGALLGAGVGAIVGGHHSVGKGAAIGAGVGAVGGAVRGSDRWNHYYWKKYNKCMSQ